MRKQPLDFRSTEVTQIMQCWRAGESCSVVGIGSIGKSNLIQHLSDPDVLSHYLNDAHSSQLRPVLIDPNMLAPLSSQEDSDAFRVWSGYELMMHRLFMSFYPFDMLKPEDARQFYETYQALQDGTNPLYTYMGLRYFELGLQYFLRKGIGIVFMFDEFEELMRQMPVKFFLSLRGLRDQYKGLLSYMTFARTPIETIAQQQGTSLLAIEPFIELFNDNVLYVGPYGSSDAQHMIHDLSTRNGFYYTEPLIEFLMYASGGFAGLLRASFHSAQAFAGQSPNSDSRELWLRQLILRPPIRKECQTIWDSLSPSEQAILNAVSHGTPYTLDITSEQAITLLVQKKLLRVLRESQRIEVQPALLRVFLTSQ